MLNRCTECAKKDAVIAELRAIIAAGYSTSLPSLPNLPRRNGPDPRDCACNPERGGSGICGCIRFSGVRC